MDLISNIARWFGLKVGDAEMREISDSVAVSFAAKRMALYIAVSYVSNALSQCEIKVYRDGRPVKDELYWALNISPNPNQNGSAFVNDLLESYFYDGHALMVQPVPSRNHFYIATSFGIDPKPLGRNVFSGVSVENQSIGRTFESGEACYFKLESTEVRSIVNGMYRDLGSLLDMAMTSYRNANGEKFTFSRNQSQGGTRADGKADHAEVNASLKNFLRNPNGVLPLYPGQSLDRVSPNGGGSSADVIAFRKDVFETTASALKIPQSMMYGNMTNIEQVTKQFITFGVDPIADMIGKEMTRGFFDFHSWKGGENRIQIDTTKIEHVNLFDVADKAEKLVSSGLMSIDQTLGAMGLDPLGTDFSQAHWITKNYSLIQDALNQMILDTDGGGDKQ